MRRIYFFLLLGFLFYPITAQTEKFKALYIYNFTKHFKFPDDKSQGDFVIAVIGDSPVAGELESIASTRKVGIRTLVIKKASKPESCSDYQMIYIPEIKSGTIKTFSDFLEGKPVIIISDHPDGIERGAGINFILVEEKLKFELNKAKIEKCKLEVSSQLLQLCVLK